MGFLDQLTASQLDDYLNRTKGIPLQFHKHSGLEDLLIECLPTNLVRQTLIENPYARHRYSEAQIDLWTSAQFAQKARAAFVNSKGHQPFHEWILDRVDTRQYQSISRGRGRAAAVHSFDGCHGGMHCRLRRLD